LSLSLQAIKEREKRTFVTIKRKGISQKDKKRLRRFEEQAMDITFAAFLHKKI
jgi:methyltransferase-like protein